MRVWITSDTHFSHKNIIKYCNRPFDSIEQMNEELIKRWNECVSDDDIVLFLGDFCFCRPAEKKEITTQFTNMLKGHKIIIKGNHDFKQLKYTDCGWDAEFYQEWAINGLNFRHRPDNIQSDAEKWDIIFYGHVHDKIIGNAPVNTFNACGDVHDFRPIDITNYFTPDELISLQKLTKMA